MEKNASTKARRNSGGRATLTKEIVLSGEDENKKALAGPFGSIIRWCMSRRPPHPQAPALADRSGGHSREIITATFGFDVANSTELSPDGFSAHDVSDAHAEGFAEGLHQGWEEGGDGWQ